MKEQQVRKQVRKVLREYEEDSILEFYAVEGSTRTNGPLLQFKVVDGPPLSNSDEDIDRIRNVLDNYLPFLSEVLVDRSGKRVFSHHKDAQINRSRLETIMNTQIRV